MICAWSFDWSNLWGKYHESTQSLSRYIHSAVLEKKIPQYVALHLILCRSGRLNIFNLKYIPSLQKLKYFLYIHTIMIKLN